MSNAFRSRWILIAALLPTGTLSAQETDAPRDPLAGPTVTTADRPPVGESAFSDAMFSRELMVSQVPPQVFERLVSSLGDESLSVGLRLAEEQEAELGSLRRSFREDSVRFLLEHRDELQAIQRLLPDSPEVRRFSRQFEATLSDEDRGRIRREVRTPENSRESTRPAPANADEALTRFRELRALAPTLAELQAKSWAVLSDAQRTHVQERLDDWRAEADQMQAESYAKRLLEQRTDQAANGQGARASTDGASTDMASSGQISADKVAAPLTERRSKVLERIPERLRERIKAMPPDERDRVLDRIADRFENRR